MYTRVQEALSKNDWIIPDDKGRYNELEVSIAPIRQLKSGLENLQSTRGLSLGHVYAASGYQERCLETVSTHTPSVLNWALIRVNEERLGDNTVWKPSPFHTTYIC